MRVVCYIFFFLSGCASLIYEVVWTRLFVLLLGSTTYAITTVVVAFMAGLALGSHLAGRWSHRVRQPGRVYGGLEIAIGLYALLVPLLMAAADPVYHALYPYTMGTHWLLIGQRYCVSMLVLIVPTTCMGATLPVMMAYLSRGDRPLGLSAGCLYGINTIGATSGCMLAGFWLMPAVGLTYTTRVAAGLNILIGLLAWWVLRGEPEMFSAKLSRRPVKQKDAPPAPVWPVAHGLVLAAAGVSGLASMIYQIAWTRALIMSIGSSTYSFTCILAAFIMGLGLGSLIMARFVDRLREPVMVLGLLEFGIGMSAALIVPIYDRIPIVVQKLVNTHYQNYEALLSLEFLIVVGVTVIPTLLMGAAFPLMTRLVGHRHPKPGEAIGQVYVVNTLGAIVGCFLAGFFLIRSEILGIRGSISAGAVAHAAMGTWLMVRSRPVSWKNSGWALAAGGGVGAVLIIGAVVDRWDVAWLTSGPFQDPGLSVPQGQMLYFREGVDTTVGVSRAKDNPDNLSLTVNAKVDASTQASDVRTQLLLGHLPALLDPEAKRACVIGLGCGMTLAAVARHPSYERLDCVEISDAVIGAVSLFALYTDDILRDPRVRVVRGDGRNHLLLTREKYDLIVSEPSNPWISGVSNLFTREFFEMCRRRLNHDGRLAIWMHSYSMSRADFRMVVRTLGDVFGFVSLWQIYGTDFCVVAGNEPFHVPASKILERYANASIRADLYRAGIRDAAGVIGTFVAAGGPLRDWASSAPLHTDDSVILEFSAPRNLYCNEEMGIAADLSKIQGSPFDDVVISSPPDEPSHRFKNRVSDVIDARLAVFPGLRQWRGGSQAQALETLIEGYKRDPGNLVVYEVILRLRAEAMGHQAPHATPSEAVQKQFEQIDRLQEPVVVPPKGATLPEIVRKIVARAQRSSAASQLPMTIDWLMQAHELAPDNGGVVANLALVRTQNREIDQAEQLLAQFLQAHPQDGRANYAAAVLALQRQKPDESLRYLELALKSGLVKPGQLTADPALASLRDNASFQALLHRYASSQPGISQPSAN